MVHNLNIVIYRNIIMENISMFLIIYNIVYIVYNNNTDIYIYLLDVIHVHL